MEYPPVSAVMPVRNEERYLAESVRHVLGQDYPGPLELVLAVGPSADRTEQIAQELAAADPRITVVANPTGKIPAALNIAVRTARYAVIARIDGHALLPASYLTTAVATLTETGAADVGGVMAAQGETLFQQAVAWGMTSKAGVGSAAFHTGGGAGPADSVYLGIYRREAIEQAGGWDEEMLRAEDWELNRRIRARGGVIWFTPQLRVTYRPRASIRTLGSQYFHYGRGRPGRGGTSGRLGWPGRDSGRGAVGCPLADSGVRDSRHVPGRDHRGRNRARPRGTRRGSDPGTRRARRHAHVLGQRVPR